VLACSIGVQLVKGFMRIELGHYLFELFALQLPGFVLIAVLALAVHTLVDNKYVGHFIALLVFLVSSRLPDFGFEDRLYRYASRPDVIYSDLNGYGHFLPAVFWFRLYWGAFAVLLLVLSYALWVRGRDGGWRGRLRAAAARMGPAAWSVAGLAGAVFVATGGWIYYNTHVVNPFHSRHEIQQLQADYERRYKMLTSAPRPSSGAAFGRPSIAQALRLAPAIRPSASTASRPPSAAVCGPGHCRRSRRAWGSASSNAFSMRCAICAARWRNSGRSCTFTPVRSSMPAQRPSGPKIGAPAQL